MKLWPETDHCKTLLLKYNGGQEKKEGLMQTSGFTVFMHCSGWTGPFTGHLDSLHSACCFYSAAKVTIWEKHHANKTYHQ